jgi:hypothetical protein
MNIHNFANRNLCEYQSIFPTIVALLDHLLLTNGNGYYFNKKTGMIEDGSRIAIDSYPTLSDSDWKELIASCHKQEREFAESVARRLDSDVDEQYLADDCAAYKKQNVNDSMFSAESMYKDLRNMRRVQESRYGRGEQWIRPYPFSKGYAKIYELNHNTPSWFIQIVINFCQAWIKFLDEELASGNVWVKPSLRPGGSTMSRDQRLLDIAQELSKDSGTEFTAPPEPESDYADAAWTTKHRDDLKTIMENLQGYCNEKAT